MTAAARDAFAVIAALGIYRGRVVPQVRRELGRRRQDAATIPDPDLRRQALAAIDEKGLNVEATAVFATLAPRRRRGQALRAMVALQAAVDYLDTLGEQECADPLRNGLQLHRALVAAVTPGAELEDWYRFHPHREDGGYLDRLVAVCQESLRSLPAREAVLAAAQRAAGRCGAGQSHSHAAATNTDSGSGAEALADWASSLDPGGGYRWWEVAAGAGSSVAVHALIAAAADSRTRPSEAAPIDAAYFPPVGALTVLLDDLIDRDADRLTGALNYVSYYGDGDEAAARLELLARRAHTAIEPLRHNRRHAAILTGVVGFYLSDRAAETPYAAPIRARLLAAAGPGVRPVMALMRRRRD